MCVCVWGGGVGGWPDTWACTCTCARIALLIQHATCMHHIVTSFLTPMAPPYFSTLSHKWHNFREKRLNIKYVFLFFLEIVCKTFLILRRIWRDIAVSVKRCYVKYRYSCRIFMKKNSLDRFSKKSQIPNFFKFSSSIRMDRQTGQTDGHDEANSLFFLQCGEHASKRNGLVDQHPCWRHML
jgi:hypothetical protein